jgi:hypothetical protein
MQKARTRRGDHIDEPLEVQARFKKLEETIMLWNALTKGEPEEYIHVDTTGGKEVYVTANNFLRFILDESFIGKYVAHQQHLEVMQHHMGFECPESSWKAALISRMADIKQGHRMFRTPNDYLGMGLYHHRLGMRCGF